MNGWKNSYFIASISILKVMRSKAKKIKSMILFRIMLLITKYHNRLIIDKRTAKSERKLIKKEQSVIEEIQKTIMLRNL